MRLLDILLISLCCIIWGANVPVTRWCIDFVPPVFLVLLRIGSVALLLIPYLRPFPKQFWLVFLISNCIGGVNFVLLFLALKYANASSVAIVGQVGLPIATVLSVIFLKEQVKWRRTIGIILALIGVIIVIYKPSGAKLEIGLFFACGSAAAGAIGTILMKRLIPIGALHLQAWVSLLSVIPLAIGTYFFEQNQWQGLMNGGLLLWVAIVFSVIAVSIVGHSAYYSLVKKYDVTLVMPFTLMVPIWAVIASVIFLNEQVTLQLVVGGLICLAGVGLIAMRQNKSLGKEGLASTRETLGL